jgi:hypothetical protein
MRVVHGSAVRRLSPHFTVYDGAFGPEMMLLSIIGGWRVVQVPLNYRARHGAPGTTDSVGKAVGIGLQMIHLVGSYRWRRAAVERALTDSAAARSPKAAGGAPAPGGTPAHLFPRPPVGGWARALGKRARR